MSSMALNALEKEHPCEYLVGDLVWVHIRGSPLWPSMISYDPSIGVYSKLSCECYCKLLVRLFVISGSFAEFVSYFYKLCCLW